MTRRRSDADNAARRPIRRSNTAWIFVGTIVVVDDGVAYGANGWASNANDRRIYTEGSYQAE